MYSRGQGGHRQLVDDQKGSCNHVVKVVTDSSLTTKRENVYLWTRSSLRAWTRSKESMYPYGLGSHRKLNDDQRGVCIPMDKVVTESSMTIRGEYVSLWTRSSLRAWTRPKESMYPNGQGSHRKIDDDQRGVCIPMDKVVTKSSVS